MPQKAKIPTLERIEEEIGPLEGYREDCHRASLAIVKSGMFNTARVARGYLAELGMIQHSWVVLGSDCYRPRAQVLDVTAWSYDENLPKVLVRPNLVGGHVPHGYGYWQHVPQELWPRHYGGPTIYPKCQLSDVSRKFLGQFTDRGFDIRGWHAVAKLPVLGWPSKEIIEAMLMTRALKALVPIDIAGMVTNRNPGYLYLKKAA